MSKNNNLKKYCLFNLRECLYLTNRRTLEIEVTVDEVNQEHVDFLNEIETFLGNSIEASKLIEFLNSVLFVY